MGAPTLAERLARINEKMKPAGRDAAYTHQEIAEGTGLALTTVDKLFSGDRPKIKGETAARLAKFYGVPTDYFLGDDEVFARVEEQVDKLELLKLLSRQPILEIAELLGEMSDPDIAMIREFAQRLAKPQKAEPTRP